MPLNENFFHFAIMSILLILIQARCFLVQSKFFKLGNSWWIFALRKFSFSCLRVVSLCVSNDLGFFQSLFSSLNRISFRLFSCQIHSINFVLVFIKLLLQRIKVFVFNIFEMFATWLNDWMQNLYLILKTLYLLSQLGSYSKWCV